MMKIKHGEFIIVPYDSVTKNGIYLEHLNTFEESYEGPFALVYEPSGKAVDNERGTPYRYKDLRSAKEDADHLSHEINRGHDFSVCGGVVKPSEDALLKKVLENIQGHVTRAATGILFEGEVDLNGQKVEFAFHEGTCSVSYQRELPDGTVEDHNVDLEIVVEVTNHEAY